MDTSVCLQACAPVVLSHSICNMRFENYIKNFIVGWSLTTANAGMFEYWQFPM